MRGKIRQAADATLHRIGSDDTSRSYVVRIRGEILGQLTVTNLALLESLPALHRWVPSVLRETT